MKKEAKTLVVEDAAGPRVPREILPSFIAAICLLIFLAKALTSLAQESATWDETHYYGLGKYLLQTGRWDVPGSILHPPLSYYLHSIPWWFIQTDASVWKSDPARVKDLQYLGSLDAGIGLNKPPRN